MILFVKKWKEKKEKVKMKTSKEYFDEYFKYYETIDPSKLTLQEVVCNFIEKIQKEVYDEGYREGHREGFNDEIQFYGDFCENI